MKIHVSSKNLTTLLAITAFISLSICTQAQNTVKTKPATDDNIHLKVFRQSAALGDLTLAITSLHYLIASDPVKYATWQDTLSLLYLQSNSYQQAYVLADALLKGKGYTDLRMEIKAISAKGLQQPAEAITDYAALYDKTKNPAFGFEQLQLQYGIRRLAETIVTGNTLLQSLSTTKSDTVVVMKADSKSVQKVTFKAAICNIMGLAYVDLKDKTNAMTQFEIALKESPDFEIAKNNMATAKAITEEAKK